MPIGTHPGMPGVLCVLVGLGDIAFTVPLVKGDIGYVSLCQGPEGEVGRTPEHISEWQKMVAIGFKGTDGLDVWIRQLSALRAEMVANKQEEAQDEQM